MTVVSCGNQETTDQDVIIEFDIAYSDLGFLDSGTDQSLSDTATHDSENDNEPGDTPHDTDEPETESDSVSGDTSGTDEISHDSENDVSTDNGSSSNRFCRSFSDCDDDESCDFSLGLCQKRDSWKTGTPALYSFQPPAGSAGDTFVVDGSVFCGASLMGCEFSTRASIGGKLVAGGTGNIGVDENRMIGVIPAGASGKVVVVFADSQGTRSFATEFESIPEGVVECDQTTPGRYAAGDRPDMTGPYAAGYLDVSTNNARIFYPAECGSVRRPGVPGTYPLFVILHGNGAVHLSHEHIGQLLATWGVITVLPKTIMSNQWSDEAPVQIKATVDQFRDKSYLGSIHPSLAGLSTTPEVAFACHSKGCYRVQEFLQGNSTIRGKSLGTVFLGPSDFNYKLPGSFMVIGGDKDGQGGSYFVNAAYDRQSSQKWKVWIKGANHGNFCDHKVYYSLDGQPSISRHEQLTIVQQFMVPFVQRIFEMDEPFASWLDTPPTSTTYSVDKSL